MRNNIYKKRKIEELLDSHENIIGQETEPIVHPNLETKANRTTDYNASVHGQNFKNNFMGRFGFYFYESENEGSVVEKELVKELGEEVAKKVMGIIQPHIKELFDDFDSGIVNEENIIEDKITSKTQDKSIKEKKEEEEIVKSDDIDKMAGIIKKLPKKQIDELIGLIESKDYENVPVPEKLKKKFKGVSLGKKKNGKYFIYTHRAASNEYESPEDIPLSKIKYIETTG